MAIGEMGSVVQGLRPISLDIIVACDVAEICDPIFLLFPDLFSFFILVTFFCVTSHVLFHLEKNVNEKQYKHRSLHKKQCHRLNVHLLLQPPAFGTQFCCVLSALETGSLHLFDFSLSGILAVILINIRNAKD